MPLQPGTTLGRYRLIERAGAGGMSEVWRAEDETLHRTVAVKVILEPIARDASYGERFLREARLVAGLEHPHILPVYDFGTTPVDGQPVSFLVMPLVGGGSLKERITGPIPFPTAVSWLSAVAQALDHAHGKGILHRDVKPGNVLLDAAGRPMLADFGLARSADTSGLTQTGAVLGTPLYMAPEQATGQALDGRADQYALAIIAFELLSGHVPFKADSPLAVLHQHVTTPPAPISSVLPGIPREADAVLSRALAKSPAERYATCTEFVNALASALGVPMSAVTVPFVPASLAPPAGAPGQSDSSQLATVLSKTVEPAKGPMTAPASVPPDATRRTKRLLAGVAALTLVGVAAILVVRRLAPKTGGVTPTPAPAAAPTSPPATAPAPTAVPSPRPEPTAIAAVPSPAFAEAAEPTPPDAAPRLGRRFERRVERREAAREKLEGRRGDGDEPPVAHREPLLARAGAVADTELSSALSALDAAQKPGGRLTRADFVDAMGGARSVLSRRSTPGARFLEAFARAGVAFADGNDATAWQLLQKAFQEDHGGLSRTRTLVFVRQMVLELERNPGRDGQWVMGLAFGDVRGDLVDELGKAGQRAPGSAAVMMAYALHSLHTGHVVDAHRYAQKACEAGWTEACGIR
ncbi:MAG TPA: protein kinase [Thermoanaerobaculia bacterium]|jgi:hypothetical protein|nr:protein kinase [Thermoanaerobaculia bacterium]